jgi:hypothetical protein
VPARIRSPNGTRAAICHRAARVYPVNGPERGLMMEDQRTSTAATHEMVCEGENAAEALFACMDEACGRRVVVGKVRPRLTVIDRGHFAVRHVGSLRGLTIDQVSLA